VSEAEEKTEFEFDELSDKAKERARDKFREHHLDYNWWEYVYDEASTTAELFGMEIGKREEGRGARTVYSPDIYFSGFYTQGSGACWNGSIYAEKLAGAVERVKQAMGEDDILVDLARQAEDLFAAIAAVHAFNRLCSDEADRDWSEVEIGMRLAVRGNARNWWTSVDDSEGRLSPEIEKAADKLVDAFGDWIYSQLEAEYEYQMDDEQIDAAIEAAGLSFDADGNVL